MFPEIQARCHPHTPRSCCGWGVLPGKRDDPCTLLPLPLGLAWAPPEVSVSVLNSRPSPHGSPAPFRVPLMLPFCQDLALGHVSRPRGTGRSPHGHVWPWCVHRCPRVVCVCVCNMQLILLGHMAPGPLAISPRRPGRGHIQPAVPSESWQPAPVQVCFAEENVNPSPDGLLDLFN